MWSGSAPDKFSYIGKRALAGLRGNPGDAGHRELTTAVMADKLAAVRFSNERSVKRWVTQPGVRSRSIASGTSGSASARSGAAAAAAAGTALTGQGCGRAVDTYRKASIPTVSVGDVICVRTSHGGVAAVTLAAPDPMEWLYWTKASGSG